MSFLYFIEKPSGNDKKPSKADFEGWGLSYILDDFKELAFGGTPSTGPGGKAGVVLCRKADGVQPRYYPDQQEWHCINGRWIGWFKGAEFKPSTFERSIILTGGVWTDWKGNDWKIPVARKHYESDGLVATVANLPTYLGWKDGKLAAVGVQTQYQKLWEIACQCEMNRVSALVIAQANNESMFTYSVGDLEEIGDVVIGTNYRLSTLELGLMQVLTHEASREIMAIVSDDASRLELQKKNLQGAGTT